jgi:hypothetical protein
MIDQHVSPGGGKPISVLPVTQTHQVSFSLINYYVIFNL